MPPRHTADRLRGSRPNGGDPQVVHAPRHGGDRGGGGRGDDSAAPSSLARGFSRLDPATMAYYAEARDALAGLESAPPPFDAEQASLLASAALREAGGREAAVSADAAGSRALEALLPYALPEDVLDFAGIVLNGDALADVATSPFGSHTAEVLLATLARLADGSAPVLRDADPEALARATTAGTAALEGVTRAFAARFYDLATHRSGSHVLRALLSCLAGRDVAPAGGGGGGGGSVASMDGSAALRATRRKASGGHAKGPAPVAGLASKVQVVVLPGGAQPAPPAAAHPALIRTLAHALLAPDYAPWLEELAYGPYSGPAVQALMRAAVGDEETLLALIPRLLGSPLVPEGGDLPRDGARLAAIPRDTILAAAKDRAGSHLLEAALAAAPRALRAELDARALRGRLADLAAHPTANFVVQAALAAADSAPAVKGALKELGPVVGELLAGRRGGVVAALVAASGRVPALPAEVVASVAAGLASARPHPAGLAAALVTLDSQEPGVDPAEAGRLSPVGCALLASLLRLPAPLSAGPSSGAGTPSSRGAGAAFGEALASLPSPTLARIAADSAGSRAVEALFSGAALGVKGTRSAAARLLGHLPSIAATPGGVHAVEAAWAAAKPADQAAMSAELAAAAGHLGTAFRTLALLRKVGADGWRGGGGAKRWGGGGGGAVAAPIPPTPVPVAEMAQEGDATPAEKKKHKKRKEGGEGEKRKKKRKEEVEA